MHNFPINVSLPSILIRFFKPQNLELFKHRELGILSRRPPLQWCQRLRFLSDPIDPLANGATTTTKAPESFSEHFLKKYEKYLRRDAQHSKANGVDAAAAADKGHRTSNSSDKKSATAVAAHRFSNSKQIYYERLWPKTKNLRKKAGKPAEALETGLTALASFPVSALPKLRPKTSEQFSVPRSAVAHPNEASPFSATPHFSVHAARGCFGCTSTG